MRVVAETHCLTYVQRTAVGFFQSHQNLDEGGFTRTVVAHDTHLLVAGKDVGEIIQNLQVAEAFAQVVGLENLGADVRSLDIQFHIRVVRALLGHLLQFIEGFFAVTGFVAACLRHTAHPFQLCAIQVVGTGNLRIGRFDAFLTFLQVVAVVSFVGVQLTVVYFNDFRAHTVQEIAVVRHHEQAQAATVQVLFQPFRHVQVEVVGRLIQNQQIRFGNQDIGQCHALQLPARQISDFLGEIADFQLRKNLLGTPFIIPRLFVFHSHQQFVHSGVAGCFHAPFILLNQLYGRVAVIKAGFEHRQFFGIFRALFQIAHA